MVSGDTADDSMPPTSDGAGSVDDRLVRRLKAELDAIEAEHGGISPEARVAHDRWLAAAESTVVASIRAGIQRFGYYVMAVQGGEVPKFAYTIGLDQTTKTELILAGGAALSLEQVKGVIDDAVAMHRRGGVTPGQEVRLGDAGAFDVGPVHLSWSSQLLKAAHQHHRCVDQVVFQLSPKGKLSTIDIPDLSVPWSPRHEPVWRWLTEPWDLPVGPSSVAMTNLDALRGEPITEVARWEDGYWEMIAGRGTDVAAADTRVVPLATLIGADQSLRAAADLDVGQALWRRPGEAWHQWQARA
jgi:hypothetical protein